MAKQKVKAKAGSEASASHAALLAKARGRALQSARSSFCCSTRATRCRSSASRRRGSRKVFALDEGKLARLFAWMAISAFGSLTARAPCRSRRTPAGDSRRSDTRAVVLRWSRVGSHCQRIRCVRDNGFRTARRIGLVGDRVARRRTSGQAARSRASGRSVGERYRRRAWLSDHSRLVGVELFVALATGAVGGRHIAGSAGRR